LAWRLLGRRPLGQEVVDCATAWRHGGGFSGLPGPMGFVGCTLGSGGSSSSTCLGELAGLLAVAVPGRRNKYKIY
jgi:hypothetical protein